MSVMSDAEFRCRVQDGKCDAGTMAEALSDLLTSLGRHDAARVVKFNLAYDGGCCDMCPYFATPDSDPSGEEVLIEQVRDKLREGEAAEALAMIEAWEGPEGGE